MRLLRIPQRDITVKGDVGGEDGEGDVAEEDEEGEPKDGKVGNGNNTELKPQESNAKRGSLIKAVPVYGMPKLVAVRRALLYGLPPLRPFCPLSLSYSPAFLTNLTSFLLRFPSGAGRRRCGHTAGDPSLHQHSLQSLLYGSQWL